MEQEKTIRIMILGRPNVGKSTLVNRIIGRRHILVDKTPGVTRDMIEAKTEWEGVRLIIRDTGGLYRIPSRSKEKTDLPDPFDEELQTEILSQVQSQFSTTDVIYFVVDGRSGIHRTDMFFADFLKKTSVPVWVIANKLDDPQNFMDSNAALVSRSITFIASGTYGVYFLPRKFF